MSFPEELEVLALKIAKVCVDGFNEEKKDETKTPKTFVAE